MEPTRWASRFARSLMHGRESAISLALVLIVLGISAFAPTFISGENLYLISRQIAFVAIVAIGELFVILTGGIDLSVGSIMGLAGVATAAAMKAGVDPIVAAAFGLVVGLAVGAINGILIAYVRIAPFIVTLAMLSSARGLILILTEGWPITQIPESFLPIAQGAFLGVPIPVWIMLVVALIAWFFLTKTAFGRRTYAIGGNEQATFLSGVNVKSILFRLYMISGLCSALAGVILVARFHSAQADTGTGWELDAIAAAVIGGTSLAGGGGSVLGVLIGAAIMGVIRNGLVLMRVSTYYQTAVIGIIIVLAAVLDRIKSSRQRSS